MLFFKKKTELLNLEWLHTDMHSHLVPGIDDGAPDLDTSLQLIKEFAKLGYKKVITTPHILWDIYPNTPEIITNGIQQVKNAILEAGIDIEIKAAAEYFIDEHFTTELKNKKPLLTLQDNLVLVEFSMLNAPMDLQEVLFELLMQNYQPVIAHPERYTYLARKKEIFDEFKTAGCYFQLNLLALTGYYGNSVQELAGYLIKKEYYDYAGTDVHHLKHLAALQKLASSSLLKKLKDAGKLKNQLL